MIKITIRLKPDILSIVIHSNLLKYYFFLHLPDRKCHTCMVFMTKLFRVILCCDAVHHGGLKDKEDQMPLMIMIDTSSSMNTHLPLSEQEIYEGPGHLTRMKAVWQALKKSEYWRQEDPPQLILFRDEIITQTRLTDPEQLVYMEKNYWPKGGTRLWDCAMAALETIYEKNTTLMVFTDGEDQSSSHTFEQVQQEARMRCADLDIIVIADHPVKSMQKSHQVSSIQEIHHCLSSGKPAGTPLDTYPYLAAVPPVFNLDPGAAPEDVVTVTQAIQTHHAYLEELTGLTYHPVPTFLVDHASIEKLLPVQPPPVPSKIDLADIWEFQRFLWGICMFVHQPHRLVARNLDALDKCFPETFIRPDRNSEISFFKDFGPIPKSYRYTVLWSLSEGCYGLVTRLIQYGMKAGLETYIKSYDRERILNQMDWWQQQMHLPGYIEWMPFEEASRKMFLDTINTLKAVADATSMPFTASSPKDFKGPCMLENLHPDNEWENPGPNLVIWRRHLDNREFETILAHMQGDQWNWDLNALITVMPIAVDTVFRLMDQFRAAHDADAYVSSRLDSWGIYTPDLSVVPHLKEQLNAPTCPGVLLSLSQLRKDCAKWIHTMGDSQEKDLISMLTLHEHTHAIIQEGMAKDGSRAWQQEVPQEDLHRYHAVSEAIAEWASLERFRNNKDISKLIQKHIAAGSLPQWPYNAAALIEKSPFPREKFKTVAGYFQKNTEAAWEQLQ